MNRPTAFLSRLSRLGLLFLTLSLTLFLTLPLTSCSFLREAIFGPSREPDIDPRNTHLAQDAGDQNQIDLGPDARSLLDQLTRVKRDYIQLKSKMEQVEAHNEQLRNKLMGTEKSLSSEMAKRAVAEAEMDRMKKEIRKQEAEFLSLSIKMAKRDHEYYALRVAALKDQLDILNAQSHGLATPPGGQNR